MLSNKIYKHFFFEFSKYFLITLLTFTAIVWTVQAVNFLDLVVEDGHALSVYLGYSLLNVPKILTKFIPLSFLISLVLTILKFENVLNVLSKNINQLKKDKFLDFLAIETNITPDNNYEMKIIFAGDSMIRIISEVIEVTLDDQGDAWDTKNKPKHKTL